MAKWLKDLFNEYLQEQLEEDLNGVKSSVEIGGVYFGSLQSLSKDKPNKPLYFVVLRKIDDNLYEVMKASDWYHFATGRDVIIDLGTMTMIVESDCNFYLTEEEISRFRLIDRIDDEMTDKIKRFREGEDVDVKKGFTPMSKYINLGDYKDIREAFKEEEFKQIREYHLRIFELLSE
ncbi:MAG: hypothetical protein JHC31_06815 [Sulfurihydrogenibium sp.]|nr:hypothetical protein [Sulfurihydrogenibium sp.]